MYEYDTDVYHLVKRKLPTRNKLRDVCENDSNI